ncbi:helix-turn-helix domain-containing protein [Phreatobacter sp.]|uniref:winged helix-turn-helix transcriptional regulator n=1 Tax=Phreatobacter sp. TaxID=1966341 RepID=UPI0022BBFE80|nr:helix-turn-helix domain-containing protein [Phreatobacter sp.]MCZ8315271.1 helix-turn-helix domain-containing protein [Phreatobacter sp.]
MGEPRIIELPPQPLPKDLPPDVFAADCPTRRVLDRVGDKWAVLILILLADGTKRFNVLRRMIGGVSQKMLSQTLKSLERDGLVSRKVIPTVPVTVEYSITPLGRTLHQAVDALRVWAETHIAAVEAAQSRYDAEAGREA